MTCWRSGRRSPVDKVPGGAGSFELVKLMSLSLDEFRRSLAFFAPQTASAGETTDFTLTDAHKTLHIHIEELAPFNPGGLIVLPRCRVTLTFTGYDEAGRRAETARFDRTFFRGGG